MNKLKYLYEHHNGKVSDKWELYLEKYDRILCEYRSHPINLLEIGVQNGGSLEIWSKYFEASSQVIGCDINRDCYDLEYDSDNIFVIVEDSNSDQAEDKVKSLANGFDIIIDDGSHHSDDIIRSFARYFPLLKDDGVYIIEDLHCSYWKSYEGGIYNLYSSMSFLKNLSDYVNREHWQPEDENFINPILDQLCKVDASIDDDQLKKLHSIEFVNSMCIIKKRPVKNNTLGRRFIVGQDNSVKNLDAHQFKGLKVSKEELDVQEQSPISTIRAYQNERSLMAEKLENLESELHGIYQSNSWKYTSLFRLASRIIKKMVPNQLR
ncbi:class I SAM-dependent methyltransferase [Marinobacter persicus]|uniref:Methyltransferase family protein n=1 Tax=Marinobacter persicus TaxID=930118 RepID=A0A2S6G2J0_9GAMM|nr:class I SAM-dependent methyltransferase [Marinobacter persicus]PPK49982.1 methyltransferase family protein [Marinobacter persicus]PPK51897.1 methyltransferase family protein [Marinobacter persicus]PPK56564.1 methyltransferase family protein [Marinobacter persicus]